jgi:hypothetical protein
MVNSTTRSLVGKGPDDVGKVGYSPSFTDAEHRAASIFTRKVLFSAFFVVVVIVGISCAAMFGNPAASADGTKGTDHAGDTSAAPTAPTAAAMPTDLPTAMPTGLSPGVPTNQPTAFPTASSSTALTFPTALPTTSAPTLSTKTCGNGLAVYLQHLAEQSKGYLKCLNVAVGSIPSSIARHTQLTTMRSVSIAPQPRQGSSHFSYSCIYFRIF